jgi:hypothetical protein
LDASATQTGADLSRFPHLYCQTFLTDIYHRIWQDLGARERALYHGASLRKAASYDDENPDCRVQRRHTPGVLPGGGTRNGHTTPDHKTPYPSHPLRTRPPPAPDRTAKPGYAWQADPGLSPGWLWQDDAAERMGPKVQTPSPRHRTTTFSPTRMDKLTSYSFG